MSPTVTTFLFELINFVVLALALGWLFFQPVRKAVQERRERIEADRQTAEEALDRARQAAQRVAAERASLQAELSTERERVTKESKVEAERLLESAKKRSAEEVERGEREAAQRAAAQEASVAVAAAEAAGVVVERLLATVGDSDLQEKLLGAACRELKTLGDLPDGVIEVCSAGVLDAPSRTRLCEAMGVASNRVAFVQQSDLGQGLRIRTPKGMVDLSVRGLSKYAQGALREALRESRSAVGESAGPAVTATGVENAGQTNG